MRKKPDQGGFLMFSGLWEHEVRNNPQVSRETEIRLK